MFPLPDDWLDALRPRRRPFCPRWSRRLKGIKYIGAIALLALGYRLLVVLTFKFPLLDSAGVYPIWPPAAYSQLVLLMVGLKFWPAIALGSGLNSLLSDQPWGMASTMALNNALQAVLGAWILLRTNFSPQFKHLRDVGLLISSSSISASLSAAIGLANYCFTQDLTCDELVGLGLNWWIGNFGSVLFLFPILLVLVPAIFKLPWRLWQRPPLPLALNALIWTIGLSLLDWFVFAAPNRFELFPFPLEYMSFPFIAWGAIRFGTVGASLGILLTMSFAYMGFVNMAGPFFQFSSDPDQAILAFQIYICVLVITALSLAASMAEREQAQQELQLEKEKSEELLLNILPRPIALRLKTQNGTIADQFAEVTVLFADIVDFTRLSVELSPRALVILLNEIFSTFDTLAEKHGLEKIKTIGDAYMVVGGLPEHRHDHGMAVAEMALDMQAAIAHFGKQHQRPFTMRIGINTGPVIAGVIGKKKFIYDLWGDTVNIASRMESSGIAGEIQVTRSTYEVLKANYHFERRGTVAVKGKGLMETYLLRDRHPVTAA